ncbi:tetratricopeptide repeat protein [Kitasatospora cineracea]|uniref:tetratricopeptide repeat protein n=1 Tax=Kitasatospora cineracea TaxID=88074 RepID=UPI003448A156
MGGIGKTALALAVGHAVRGSGAFTGVVFLDLRGYDDVPAEASHVLDDALRQLDVGADRIPPGLDQRASLYRAQLAARARNGERVLVIADNASHVAQIEHLRPGDGPHRLLITSRDDLSAVGARLVDLDVLRTDEAVDLLDTVLQERLGADDRIGAHPDGTRRIAELCGGLPLALHLAAALLVGDRGMTPGQLADDLEDPGERLDLLDDGSRTVRAVLDRSYRRLTPPQQELFRLLGLNPGPDLSLDATAALTGADRSRNVRPLLIALANASLVQQSRVGRWSMHDLVRAYAREHAGRYPEPSAEALRRLLAHYTEVAADADGSLRLSRGSYRSRFDDRGQALEWFDAEYTNLVMAVRTAQEAGHHAISMRLPKLLAHFLRFRRHIEDQLAVCTVARDSATVVGTRSDQAASWHELGLVLQELRRSGEAEHAHRTAIDMYRESGNRHGEARGLSDLASLLCQSGRAEEAERVYCHALAICQELRDKSEEAIVWNRLGLVLQESGRHEEAESAHRAAAANYHECGDQHGEAIAWSHLGGVLRELGRFGEAEQAHQNAIDDYRQLGPGHDRSFVLNNLGLTLRESGRYDEAERAHREALADCERFGDQHGTAVTWNHIGMALRGAGRFGEAAEAGRRAAALFGEGGDDFRQGKVLEEVAATLEAAECPAPEVRAYREAAADCYRRAGAEAEAANALERPDS